MINLPHIIADLRLFNKCKYYDEGSSGNSLFSFVFSCYKKKSHKEKLPKRPPPSPIPYKKGVGKIL